MAKGLPGADVDLTQFVEQALAETRETRELLTTAATTVPDSSASRYKGLYQQATAELCQAQSKIAKLEHLIEDDQAGYVLASWLAPLYEFSDSTFSKWLDSISEDLIRRKKPFKNRRLVHAGDLVNYMQNNREDPKIVDLLKRNQLPARCR